MINMERMLFCSILLMVLLCGCLKRQSPQKYTARYGIEYNSVRDSLGIVLLDSSWVAFKVWDYRQDMGWKFPPGDETSTNQIEKTEKHHKKERLEL